MTTIVDSSTRSEARVLELATPTAKGPTLSISGPRLGSHFQQANSETLTKAKSLAGLSHRNAIAFASPKSHSRSGLSHPPTKRSAVTMPAPSAGSNSTTSHRCREYQTASAGCGPTLPGGHTTGARHCAGAAGTQAAESQRPCVGHAIPALGPIFAAAHHRSDNHGGVLATAPNFRDSQPCVDAHSASVVAEPFPTRPAHGRTQLIDPQTAESHMSTEPHGYRALGPILDNPVLGIFAETLDDLEKIRCASENRLRALTDTSELGHGLDLRHPDVAYLAASVEQMKAAEHQAILNLQRVMRKDPLWAWAKPLRGVGEKQFARLLASIGDPYWNDLHNRPRKLSELRAYCGFHVIQTTGSQDHGATQTAPAAGSNVHPDSQICIGPHDSNAVGVAPKRARGQKSNWNEDARKRTWLIATSCLKQPAGTRYRDIYDLTRIKYADAVHQTDCVRCGPAGKPAQAGSALSLGHQHARGLRAISKALLADMWREAKRIHEATANSEDE